MSKKTLLPCPPENQMVRPLFAVRDMSKNSWIKAFK